MPKRLESRLRAEAKAKGFDKETTNRYVYSTLRKMGWKPKRKR